MIIDKLELTNFGRFYHKTVSFTGGLNAVYVRNESTRSVYLSFICAMFLGMPDTGESAEQYERCRPDESRGPYGGRLWFSRDGIVYRIEREFTSGAQKLSLFDETHERPIEPAAVRLKELIGGLTAAGFMNMLRIGRIPEETPSRMARITESQLQNLCSARHPDVDAQEALRMLKVQRKRLVSSISARAEEEVRQCEMQLTACKSRLHKLKKKKSVLDAESALLGKKVAEETAANDEKLLGYERERERLRRQYVSAKKAYEERPRIDRRAMRSGGLLWIVFLVFCLAFAAAGTIFFVTRGLSSKEMYYIITAFYCISFLSGMGMLLSIVLGKQRTQKKNDEYRLARNLKRNLEKSVAAFEECMAREPRGLDERVEPLIRKKEAIDEEILSLSGELVSERETKERLDRKLEDLVRASRLNGQSREELEAVDQAIRTLDGLSTDIRESFGKRLKAEILHLYEEISGIKYDDLQLGELNRAVLTQDGEEIPLRSLGQKEQKEMYLCVRTAAAMLLWQQEEMPLLFDDTFADCDDELVDHALEMLRKSGRQALVFMSH